MFLDKTIQENPELVEFGLYAVGTGILLPDTYLLDVDTIVDNAIKIKQTADTYDISLYFMLKQIGRNPIVANKLMEIGYAGAVCVDFREALCMIREKIPLGNVGHLVQTPKAALQQILDAKPQIMTIYSIEKAKEINEICKITGQIQEVMLRVIGKNDLIYSGQEGGFLFDDLCHTVMQLEQLSHIRLGGVCGFPCVLYNKSKGMFEGTKNLETVKKAFDKIKDYGYEKIQLNLPSANCVKSLPFIASHHGTHAEPGHGLSGTTPYHEQLGQGPERPAIVYLSEISHTHNGRSYCYGGGHYRRGHLKQAIVGKNLSSAKRVLVKTPSDQSIDYYFELEEPCLVSQGVVMSFRTQIFTTRSEVALVEGLKSGNPRVVGRYSSIGQAIEI